jgi:hypothetical protein
MMKYKCMRVFAQHYECYSRICHVILVRNILCVHSAMYRCHIRLCMWCVCGTCCRGVYTGYRMVVRHKPSRSSYTCATRRCYMCNGSQCFSTLCYPTIYIAFLSSCHDQIYICISMCEVMWLFKLCVLCCVLRVWLVWCSCMLQLYRLHQFVACTQGVGYANVISSMYHVMSACMLLVLVLHLRW